MCSSNLMLSMPYYVLCEMISPLIEFFGIILIPLAWYFGFIPMEYMVLFFTAIFGFRILTSIGSIAVEEFTNASHLGFKGILFLSVLSVIENLFYRQMNTLFRLTGIFSYRKNKNALSLTKRQKLFNT